VPKSRRGRRVIDLDVETVRPLVQHAGQQHARLERVGRSAPVDDRVFTNEAGGTMRPGSVSQAFRRLVSSVGVPAVRLHDLRHTHASHLLGAGVNVKVVSERLGHSSEMQVRADRAQVPGEGRHEVPVPAPRILIASHRRTYSKPSSPSLFFMIRCSEGRSSLGQ
jgi:integrase